MMHNQSDHPFDDELRALRDRRLARLQQAAPAGKPLALTDATIGAAAAAHDVLVVDVWAPWCGPCRIIGPILDDLANELAGKVTIGKVNADENPGAVARFGVRGIPTLLVFKGGRLVDRIVGAAPKATLKARFLAHAA